MLSLIIFQKHTFSDYRGVGKLEFVKVGWTVKCFGAYNDLYTYLLYNIKHTHFDRMYYIFNQKIKAILEDRLRRHW